MGKLSSLECNSLDRLRSTQSAREGDSATPPKQTEEGAKLRGRSGESVGNIAVVPSERFIRSIFQIAPANCTFGRNSFAVVKATEHSPLFSSSGFALAEHP